jgi:ketosteroid isomerase-like protein
MTQTPVVLLRIEEAITAHDVAALVACFADDYRNETPAHPARSFTGQEQVRRNWAAILATVPDLTATLVRWSRGPAEPGAVWAEWDWTGTRDDGHAVSLRGITVLGIGEDGPEAGVVRWARFYMEPVDDDPTGPTESARRAVGAVR